MNEIERFSKKAAHYREALQRSPTARVFELYPICQLLHMHAGAISKPISELKILDLMSGSGFLAENLHKVGFRNLHAVEFCGEMCTDASAYAQKVRLHRLTDFDHLEGYLDSIAPDIIVSLASFHHLLRYDNSGNLDLSASHLLQKKVVDICMRSLPRAGLLVIADLIEDGVTDTPLPDDPRAMRAAVRDVEILGMPNSVSRSLQDTGSIRAASSTLARELCTRTGNVSLDWFREVVDKSTSIGHKDAAISTQLIELLSAYNPSIAGYYCPWMFDSTEERDRFLHMKFGFMLDDGTPRSITPASVGVEAEKKLGVKTVHGKVFIGWNLGVMAIWRSDPFEMTRRFRKIVASLVLLNIFLGIALVLRNLAGVYVAPSVPSLLIFAITLPIGVAFGDVIQYLSSSRR